MLKIIKLEDEHLPLLNAFCDAARQVGYTNNSSPNKMKFGGHYDLGVMPHFWGLLKHNELVSVSGYHMWPDADRNYTTMRCVFRSATLPAYDNIIPGMSKNHMNSVPFSILLPFQLKHGILNGARDYLITTSHGDHDASGKMKRTHRVMELLAKRGITKHHREHIVYHIPQTLWKLNLSAYHKALMAFHPMRQTLGFTGFDDIYEDRVTNGF